MESDSDFYIDADNVDQAATGIRQSIESQEAFELRGLCGDTALYGRTPLRDALMDFSVRWSGGLDLLTEDADQISDALSKSVKVYRAVDGVAADSVSHSVSLGAVQDG